MEDGGRRMEDGGEGLRSQDGGKAEGRRPRAKAPTESVTLSPSPLPVGWQGEQQTNGGRP